MNISSFRGSMKENSGVWLAAAIFFMGAFLIIQTVFGANITSQVVVGNAAPTVSSVTVNNGTSITLTANATTAISVAAILTDTNGCSDITGGTSTILLYRAGVTSSSCMTNASNTNCYVNTAYTASSTCSSGVQNVTSTFGVYYFAQATDSSSSFSGSSWKATVIARDSSNATGTADSAGVTLNTLNTLNAINVTTSSINYGSVSANSNTGAVNQVATTTNAGNSSTTLQLAASQTLTSGANTIATSSQVYSTSTFTYAGTSTALTGPTPGVTVTGFLLTAPTSTSNVQQPTFWGLAVPNGTATGTYTGTNVFTALFQS